MNRTKAPKPTSRPARLAKSTGRCANIRMSTRGSRTRRSTCTHTAAITTDPAKLPSVRPEAQPHSWPWVMGSRSRTRVAARVRVPAMSVRPPVLCRVAGTMVTTAIRTSTAMPVASQKALR